MRHIILLSYRKQCVSLRVPQSWVFQSNLNRATGTRGVRRGLNLRDERKNSFLISDAAKCADRVQYSMWRRRSEPPDGKNCENICLNVSSLTIPLGHSYRRQRQKRVSDNTCVQYSQYSTIWIERITRNPEERSPVHSFSSPLVTSRRVSLDSQNKRLYCFVQCGTVQYCAVHCTRRPCAVVLSPLTSALCRSVWHLQSGLSNNQLAHTYMQQHVSRVWHNAVDCSQFAFSFSLLDVNATRLGCSVLHCTVQYSEARTTLLWCIVHIHVRVLVNDTYVRPRRVHVQYCSRTFVRVVSLIVRRIVQYTSARRRCASSLARRRRRIRALSNAPERNCGRLVASRLVSCGASHPIPSHPIRSVPFRSVPFRSVRERSCGRS